MKICAMCLNEMCDKGRVTVSSGFREAYEEYSVCPKCRKKLKKYIKFEQAKNKHK